MLAPFSPVSYTHLDVYKRQRAEMEAAFEPECLTFFEDRLEVSFDRGVLPSCETCFTLVLDLDEDVLPLIQPLACLLYTSRCV